MSEPREFEFILLKRAAQYLVGKPKQRSDFRRQKHVVKINVFPGRFRWRSSLEREYDVIGGSDWKSHYKIWIHSSELDSIECWRSGVLRSIERRSSWTIFEIYVPTSANSNED